MRKLSPNVRFPPIADITRSFQNDLMATAERDNAIGKRFGWASIANSLLLPLSAALHLNVTFWILVVTNFLLMHAIWISQVVRVRRWDRADFQGLSSDGRLLRSQCSVTCPSQSGRAS